MNRFLWMVRREIWEHKAIWVAPAIVLGCILLLLVFGKIHVGPFDVNGVPLANVTPEQKVRILMYAYSAFAPVVFLVMGVISFFYSIDALYADRRDRSVLFWKSLPLSDAETVVSKFAVAIVVIPLVALAATIAAQLVVAAGASVRIAASGGSAGFLWEPAALFGGFGVAVLWCVTIMLWYAPFVGYLMLASAWAPRSPFLWAVLPPVAIWIIEAVVMRSSYAGDFIKERLLVLPFIERNQEQWLGHAAAVAGDKIDKVTSIDLYAVLGSFYRTPELWGGVLAAALLLAAAMWVRRYRDETA
jgi:ABC-2 type transport system permease protein